MDHDTPLTSNASRMIAALIGAGVLGVAAFMLTPAGSLAGSTSTDDALDAHDPSRGIGSFGTPPQTPHTSDEQVEGPILGRLVGRRHRVTIESTLDGPRYWLYSLSGQLIAPRLTAQELHQRDPSFDLPSTQADDAGLAPTGRSQPLPFEQGTPLMLVEEDATDW